MIGDRFTRSVRTRTVERHGRFERSSSGWQCGETTRWPRAGGGPALTATAAGQPPESLPPDPTPLLARTMGVEHVHIQTAIVASSWHAANRRRSSWTSQLAFATLALPGPGGELRRSRVARALSPDDVAGDSAALVRACEIARTAAVSGPPPPRSLLIEPAVAAALLGVLWDAWWSAGAPPLPAPAVVDLVDDARPAGGPLGEPLDARGHPTRELLLAGEAMPNDGCGTPEFAPRWLSFAALPARMPYNLQIRAHHASLEPTAGMTGTQVRVLALERVTRTGAPRVSATLLAETPQSEPLRLHTAFELGQFLTAITAAGAMTWHSPVAGSPWLLLEGCFAT